jgi:DNA-binding beta-propeller fold protein YncE
VLRLDESGHRTVDRIQVERGPSAIVATRDGVWVANTGSGTLSEISPSSGTVVASVRVGEALSRRPPAPERSGSPTPTTEPFAASIRVAPRSPPRSSSASR